MSYYKVIEIYEYWVEAETEGEACREAARMPARERGLVERYAQAVDEEGNVLGAARTL